MNMRKRIALVTYAVLAAVVVVLCSGATAMVLGSRYPYLAFLPLLAGISFSAFLVLKADKESY